MAESTLNVASLLLKRKNIVDGFVTDFKSLYQSIVTDPYKNISQLTEYFSAYYKTDLPSVKSKILTQLTDIFVDLAPGYKINLTELEQTKHSKDTQQTVVFEKTYLKFYNQYLGLVSKIQKDLLKPTSKKYVLENPSSVFLLKCLCGNLSKILSHMSHFNESEKVFDLVISTIMKIPASSENDSLFDSLTTHFEMEQNIESSLKIMELVSNYSKDYQIPAKLISTFTALKLDSIEEPDSKKMPTKNETKKVKKAKKSKKNEKNLKEQKSLIHEKNYKMIRKNKSKIFNLIFVIYLKVLKSPNTNLSVLSSVLNGIAHFISHINCFIYIQIIGLINTHLKQENLKPVDKLNILLIMMKFPKLPDNFELDNNTFYEILYQTIYDICAGCGNDAEFDSNFNLLTQAIQQLIIRKPREVGTKRSTAFTKRLMNMALFTKSIYVTKIYDLVSEIYQKHPQLSRILDSQSNVGTTFLDTVEHPEYCCPDGIVLWEYHLFQNHFDTGFRKPLFQKFI